MRRQTVDPRIRAKVIATYGNRCWLGMPGCSITATEDDHIIPFSHGGQDTVANLRRACKRWRDLGPLLKLLDRLEPEETQVGYTF